MSLERLGLVEQRLEAAGACKLESYDATKVDGDVEQVAYYEYRAHTLKLTQGIRDGLSCFVANSVTLENPENAEYVSLFSLTVPGFDSFTTEQKIDWIVSVPKDVRYVDFLMEHIERLPE